MKYRITYLFNTDYCRLKPSDTACHMHCDIIANSKVEAVMQFHDSLPIQKTGSLDKREMKREVWSIEEQV